MSDGYIAINGWVEKTDRHYSEFIKEMEDIGVETVVLTDISRDGAMKGCNVPLYKSITECSKLKIIASGGGSSFDDIVKLRSSGVYGAIVGKAYYTGAVNLKQAIEVAK